MKLKSCKFSNTCKYNSFSCWEEKDYYVSSDGGCFGIFEDSKLPKCSNKCSLAYANTFNKNHE
jgi:hypothetical protein